jgi:hypothetical protein
MLMLSKSKYAVLLLASLALIAGFAADRALAVSVDAARKCQALTAKAYPPRESGNPAAGSAKGSGSAEQAYFRKCLANAGNKSGAQRRKSK